MYYLMNGWAPRGYGLGYAHVFPWGGLMMLILFLAILAVAVLAIIRLAKANKSLPPVGKPSPLDILSERFARGEIDAETYRLMKGEIGKKD
jgi:putative membrane protein